MKSPISNLPSNHSDSPSMVYSSAFSKWKDPSYKQHEKVSEKRYLDDERLRGLLGSPTQLSPVNIAPKMTPSRQLSTTNVTELQTTDRPGYSPIDCQGAKEEKKRKGLESVIDFLERANRFDLIDVVKSIENLRKQACQENQILLQRQIDAISILSASALSAATPTIINQANASAAGPIEFMSPLPMKGILTQGDSATADKLAFPCIEGAGASEIKSIGLVAAAAASFGSRGASFMPTPVNNKKQNNGNNNNNNFPNRHNRCLSSSVNLVDEFSEESRSEDRSIRDGNSTSQKKYAKGYQKTLFEAIDSPKDETEFGPIWTRTVLNDTFLKATALEPNSTTAEILAGSSRVASARTAGTTYTVIGGAGAGTTSTETDQQECGTLPIRISFSPSEIWPTQRNNTGQSSNRSMSSCAAQSSFGPHIEGQIGMLTSETTAGAVEVCTQNPAMLFHQLNEEHQLIFTKQSEKQKKLNLILRPNSKNQSKTKGTQNLKKDFKAAPTSAAAAAAGGIGGIAIAAHSAAQVSQIKQKKSLANTKPNIVVVHSFLHEAAAAAASSKSNQQQQFHDSVNKRTASFANHGSRFETLATAISIPKEIASRRRTTSHSNRVAQSPNIPNGSSSIKPFPISSYRPKNSYHSLKDSLEISKANSRSHTPPVKTKKKLLTPPSWINQ